MVLRASQAGMLDGMPQIAIRISSEELALLDSEVDTGRFKSRAAVVRAGLAALVRETESQAIAESYRQAYRDNPPDEWFAEVNTELLDARLAGSEKKATEE